MKRKSIEIVRTVVFLKANEKVRKPGFINVNPVGAMPSYLFFLFNLVSYNLSRI